MSKYGPLMIAAAIIGVVNALVLELFELFITDGTDFVWNVVFRTDKYRLGVIPLAIVLSILFSAILRLLKQPRVTEPKINPLESDDKENAANASLAGMGTVLASGASSLLAGASLGPEAPLTDFSKGLGGYVAGKFRLGKAAPVLLAASVGALMVAFLGSFFVVVLPFLIIYQKAKKIPTAVIMPIVVACASSYGVIWLIDRHNQGIIELPVIPNAGAKDYLTALILGIIAAVAAFTLNRLIIRFAAYNKTIDLTLPWYVSAAVFGLMLGSVYMMAGQSVEFTGKEGVRELVTHQPGFGTWALLGLAVAKLLATAVSKASGYRGGLVFPSLYIGMAFGLLIGTLFTSLDGPGLVVGAVTGIFAAVVGSGLVGFLLIGAILPVKLLGVAAIAAIASSLGLKLLNKQAGLLTEKK